MTILDQLAQHAAERVRKDKETVSLQEIKELALSLDGDGRRFYDVMAAQGLSVIGEVKKASPSKGLIDPVFDYRRVVREYEEAGIDAISCLTEPKWFLGSDQIFRDIRSLTDRPMLRKDFIIDEYQIYQARVMGADCVLLICTLLEAEKLRRYLDICEQLKLAALVEAHDEPEIIKAVNSKARMIGVNNRNLKDFSVDLNNARRLRSLIPADRLYVAESGVTRPQQARVLKQIGADGILIGEALMRAADRRQFIKEIKEGHDD